MSLPHSYRVRMSGSDIAQITRDDGVYVVWSDPDFQEWNTYQTPPFALSTAQQVIQQLKTLSYSQWQANVTPAQRDRILYELVQRVIQGGVV